LPARAHRLALANKSPVAPALLDEGVENKIYAMKIAAIREKFVNEWVATKVTVVGKADVPLAGEVLTHSPEKQEVYRSAKAYLAQHPEVRLFIFFTGDPIPQDVEVMLALR